MAKGFMSQEIGEHEKSKLASDIIGKGKQGNGTAPGTDVTGSQLPGTLHGDVRIEKAANGIVVRHGRHIPRAVKKQAHGGGGMPAHPDSDQEYKEHTHVFNHGDSEALMAHLNQIGVLDK